MNKRHATRWFHPNGPTFRKDFLAVARIRLNEGETLERRRLVISVPGVCGNAVQRNRFRRIVRSLVFAKIPAEQGIWIRLDRRCRLERKLRSKDFSQVLEELLRKALQP